MKEKKITETGVKYLQEIMRVISGSHTTETLLENAVLIDLHLKVFTVSTERLRNVIQSF